MSEISVPILEGKSILLEEGCSRVECPFCKKMETPSLIAGIFNMKNNYWNQITDAKFVANFKCCDSLYFVSCKSLTLYSEHNAYKPEGGWAVIELPEIKGRSKNLPETIKRISPSFEAIYAEAKEAKNAGLMNICGGAFRKALEFLLREYAMILHPDKTGEIRTMSLSNCISKYIDNNVIKCFADRAAWLGNDELHYLRKWEDRDIFDLEDFIEHAILAIDLEERRKELERDMPKPEDPEKEKEKNKEKEK